MHDLVNIAPDPEDSNPSKSEQVQCDACEDHTYVNNEIISQAENTGFRPTACINQEMLGPGYGSIDYDPSNHTQIMLQEEYKRKHPEHKKALRTIDGNSHSGSPLAVICQSFQKIEFTCLHKASGWTGYQDTLTVGLKNALESIERCPGKRQSYIDLFKTLEKEGQTIQGLEDS